MFSNLNFKKKHQFLCLVLKRKKNTFPQWVYSIPLNPREIRKKFHKLSKFCFLGYQQSFNQQLYYTNGLFCAIH